MLRRVTLSPPQAPRPSTPGLRTLQGTFRCRSAPRQPSPCRCDSSCRHRFRGPLVIIVSHRRDHEPHRNGRIRRDGLHGRGNPERTLGFGHRLDFRGPGEPHFRIGRRQDPLRVGQRRGRERVRKREQHDYHLDGGHDAAVYHELHYPLELRLSHRCHHEPHRNGRHGRDGLHSHGNPSAPSASATGWTSAAPASHTFASAGAKMLYAWAKDAAGNVSASASSTITVAVSDATIPVVTSFTIPVTSSSLTIAITAFKATDDVAVTGYLLTERGAKPAANARGWRSIPPASYTFRSAGRKTLYAWAKDGSGNVSAAGPCGRHPLYGPDTLRGGRRQKSRDGRLTTLPTGGLISRDLLASPGI